MSCVLRLNNFSTETIWSNKNCNDRIFFGISGDKIKTANTWNRRINLSASCLKTFMLRPIISPISNLEDHFSTVKQISSKWITISVLFCNLNPKTAKVFWLKKSSYWQLLVFNEMMKKYTLFRHKADRLTLLPVIPCVHIHYSERPQQIILLLTNLFSELYRKDPSKQQC